jgi:hypothetical protein
MNVLSNAVTTLLFTAVMMVLFAIYVTAIHLGADFLGGTFATTDEYFHATVTSVLVATLSLGTIFGALGSLARYPKLAGNLLSIVVSLAIAATLVWYVALPNLNGGLDFMLRYDHFGWLACMLFAGFCLSAAKT